MTDSERTLHGDDEIDLNDDDDDMDSSLGASSSLSGLPTATSAVNQEASSTDFAKISQSDNHVASKNSKQDQPKPYNGEASPSASSVDFDVMKKYYFRFRKV